MKRLLNALTLAAFFVASYFTVLLLYSNQGLSSAATQPRSQQGDAGNGTVLFAWARPQAKPQVNRSAHHGVKPTVRFAWARPQAKLQVNRSAHNVVKPTEGALTSAPEGLPPCPDKPPELVGPLLVEFRHTLGLEEVKRELNVPLRLGGRHMPPDCVSRHKVAVIIPFRNRDQHLNHWLYYLHPILRRQQLDYGVYIINQHGDGTFNRAKLLNVGYVEALKDYNYTCFVFSDVDLVPMDDRNLYRCFGNPRHLAVAMDKFGFKLPYSNFFGGVSSLSKEQYLKINGFPNTYWGWGGEDDDIYRRIRFCNMSISRPDLVMGKYKMIRHERDLHNEVNPESNQKLGKAHLNIEIDGLNTLDYRVVEVVKNSLFTNITVDIGVPHAVRR